MMAAVRYTLHTEARPNLADLLAEDYRLQYVDGCFHPFVFKAGEQPPAFV